MDITEVRIKLMDVPGDRLRAFCSITFDDCFVVRDLKVIDGTSGPFVAMPSRKLTSHCPDCGCKNHLRAAYCNQCGLRLKDDLAIRDEEGRMKLYADIAHPINADAREMIQDRVLEEYEKEVELSKQPGYRSRYDDFFDDGEEGNDYADEPAAPSPTEREDTPSTKPTTHIEAADYTGPKAPHSQPAKQQQRQSSEVKPTEQGDDSDFGKGIFDE